MRVVAASHLRRSAQMKYASILRAASRLFLRHGYTRTSMDAVAKEADVSKQTVYSYFKNKDELFQRMIEEECARHTPPDSMLENGSLTMNQALFKIGMGFIDMISSPRGLAIHRLVMAEVERHPRVAKLFYDSGPLVMQGLLVRYLKRQSQLGAVVIDDVERAATDFFALVKGRYHLKMQLKVKPLPTARDIEKHLHETVQVFLKIYGKKS
ncbi:MAG: TetR/AcrR family transcriptional regulator [Rickettsiales bacterium]|jgi:TetR/AcrR family transcriptional repressor of mexJK operon|nr:TetR/AcrR family transcriptional regulator [Rickettsiales bacterium]